MSLYAELLTNIRQISLAASLPSQSDASTKVTLAADGSTVELRHGSVVSQLTLPAKAAVGATALPIQDKQKGTTTLSWRLPLDASSHSPRSPQHQDALPWSATDLVPSSATRCRHCNVVVVPAGAVKTWKDLPSENWAEMMEFWHCHKPDHRPDHDHSHGKDGDGKADERSLASRGYGASSAITAQTGVGFVDLTTLLFAENDCENLTFSLSGYDQGATNRESLPLNGESILASKNRNLNIFCSSCHTQLGFFHFRTSAVTLLKWQVSCESSLAAAAPGIPECLAATLISTMSRSGSSKTLITPIPETIEQTANGNLDPNAGSKPDSNTQIAIHIWLLNPSILYTTTKQEQIEQADQKRSQRRQQQFRPTPAIKLLYRPIARAAADEMLESVTCDAQEVGMPAQAIGTVIRHLEESNGLLPETERVFRPPVLAPGKGKAAKVEWKVGLLTRTRTGTGW
ncbi:hypothetical protein VTK26DRAFT_5551 [Humicola hyalothermophila]